MKQTITNKIAYEVINNCIEALDFNHVKDFHIGQSDDELKNRCRYERKRTASTFNDDVDVEALIEDVLYDDVQIISWIKDNENKGYYYVTKTLENCGRKFENSKAHNWEDGAITCNNYIIIFGKEYDGMGCIKNIYVRNCFPC